MFTGEMLVIARHGSYNFTTKELSQAGQEQASWLAPQLSDYLGQLCSPNTTKIISSSALRAREFATILASKLQLGTATNDDALGNADGNTGDIKYMINQLQIYLDNRALILITHQDPSWLLATRLFNDRQNDVVPLDEGNALGFNTRDRQITVFQRPVF